MSYSERLSDEEFNKYTPGYIDEAKRAREAEKELAGKLEFFEGENQRLLRELVDARRLCAESWDRFYKLGESHGLEIARLKEQNSWLQQVLNQKEKR
jgi:hypothetical protein